MIKATYLRLVALLAFISVSAFATETQPLTQDETTELAFKIEDSKSYVGIAAVKLSVSKLVQEDGQGEADPALSFRRTMKRIDDHERNVAVAAEVGPTVESITDGQAVDPELRASFDLRGGYLKPAEGAGKLATIDEMLREDLARAGVQAA